jgi:hypothetical protein
LIIHSNLKKHTNRSSDGLQGCIVQQGVDSATGKRIKDAIFQVLHGIVLRCPVCWVYGMLVANLLQATPRSQQPRWKNEMAMCEIDDVRRRKSFDAGFFFAKPYTKLDDTLGPVVYQLRRWK